MSRTQIQNKAHELLEYIESKNSHGKNQFTAKAKELGLGKALFVQEAFREHKSQ